MIAETPAYAGSFTEIEAAERACQQLAADGFAPDAMTLWVNEECPACQEEHARSRDGLSDRLITGGQIAGGIVGTAFGVALVWWPPSAAMRLDWREWLVQLCVIASWLLTGAILGAMVGAVASELRPGRQKPAHRHFILSLRPPPGREDEALAILRRTKATIEGEGTKSA